MTLARLFNSPTGRAAKGKTPIPVSPVSASWANHTVTESINVKVSSDETTNIISGSKTITFRMPYAFKLNSVRGQVSVAPSGSQLIVNLRNSSGNTILNPKLHIDSEEKTSTTSVSASAVVAASSSFADDAEIYVDVNQKGSEVSGSGLKITLYGTRV